MKQVGNNLPKNPAALTVKGSDGSIVSADTAGKSVRSSDSTVVRRGDGTYKVSDPKRAADSSEPLHNLTALRLEAPIPEENAESPEEKSSWRCIFRICKRRRDLVWV